MVSFEDMMMRRLRGEPIPTRVETIKRDLGRHGERALLPSEWDDALIGLTAPDALPLYEFRKLVEIRMRSTGARSDQQKECERYIGEMLSRFDPAGDKICVSIVYGHIQ